jgi:TolA-binding protein
MMLRAIARLHFPIAWIFLAVSLGLTGCATKNETQVEMEGESLPVAARPGVETRKTPTPESQRIRELERQLVERQRHCLEDKNRLEQALRENQKRSEELQKKLDSLLAIDRELRTRGKGN